MADITMCLSLGCPYAAYCYRKTAKKDKLQSYSDFYTGEPVCKYFWKDESRILMEVYDGRIV